MTHATFHALKGTTKHNNAGKAPEQGMDMDLFQAIADSGYETKEQQQKYLDTIKSENEKRAENIRNENLRLIDEMGRGIESQISRMADDQSRFRSDVSTELSSVRRWFGLQYSQ